MFHNTDENTKKYDFNPILYSYKMKSTFNFPMNFLCIYVLMSQRETSRYLHDICAQLLHTTTRNLHEWIVEKLLAI